MKVNRNSPLLFFVGACAAILTALFFINSGSADPANRNSMLTPEEWQTDPSPFQGPETMTNTGIVQGNTVSGGSGAGVNSLLSSNFWQIKDFFSVDPGQEYITDYKIKSDQSAVVTTDKNVYYRKDGKWIKVSDLGIPYNSYLSSCELITLKDVDYIVVGTSFTGLYYKKATDSAFTLINKGIRRTFFTADYSSYFETVSALAAYGNYLYIGYWSSKGIDRIPIATIAAASAAQPPVVERCIVPLSDPLKDNIQKIYPVGTSLYAFSNCATYLLAQDGSTWTRQKEFGTPPPLRDDGVRGLYLNPFAASSTAKIDSLIKMAKDLDFNAFIIDMKDDFGYLSYGSTLELAKKMGTSRNLIKLDYLIEQGKKNGIKIIARLVTFKDPIAFEWNNHQMALYSISTKSPWYGKKGDRWIDPYNEDYHKYLIDVAKELQSRGVYEIQFDYVRFPSDGDIGDIWYRYRKNDLSKNMLLYSFFSKVRNAVTIPISADFYGYQCWYPISNHVGQDLFLISSVIDAIYPMYYPSHFTLGFYDYGISQSETNYYIYYHGAVRAAEISQNRVAVRPWVQVFRMGVRIDYATYIKAQIDGLKAAGIRSYFMWNPASSYDILYSVFPKTGK